MLFVVFKNSSIVARGSSSFAAGGGETALF